MNWYIEYPSTRIRSDYYLQPFHTYIWLSLLSIIFIANILMAIIKYLSRDEKLFFADIWFMGFETFCNQCGNDDVKNISIRIISMFLRASAVIFIALYGAIITSFIAVEIPQPPFTNIKEFVENDEYKLEILESGPLHVYLNVSPEKNVKEF